MARFQGKNLDQNSLSSVDEFFECYYEDLIDMINRYHRIELRDEESNRIILESALETVDFLAEITKNKSYLDHVLISARIQALKLPALRILLKQLLMTEISKA